VFFFPKILNWLDILIALIVTLPTFFGFRKGFLRKLLGIAGIILGFILAVKFYDSAASLLSTFIKGNPVFVNVLGFLLIIAILYGLAIWLARFMANMNSGTTLVDKILGTVVGFIQGVIVASVLLFNLSLADMPSRETRESSMLYSTVYKVAPAIFDKVIDLFPGLQETYFDYKNQLMPQNTPPKEQEPNKNNSPKKPK
jgi:membrane protein required for colicin V production